MKTQVIEFDTAKMAFEKYFLVRSRHAYDEDGNLESAFEFKGELRFNAEDLSNAKDNTGKEYFLAPEQPVLQKWLREKHDIIVEPGYIPEKRTYGYVISIPAAADLRYEKGFNGWEEALEAGLKEGLKLI